MAPQDVADLQQSHANAHIASSAIDNLHIKAEEQDDVKIERASLEKLDYIREAPTEMERRLLTLASIIRQYDSEMMESVSEFEAGDPERAASKFRALFSRRKAAFSCLQDIEDIMSNLFPRKDHRDRYRHHTRRD